MSEDKSFPPFLKNPKTGVIFRWTPVLQERNDPVFVEVWDLEAEKKQVENDKVYKCDFPNCKFETTTRVALAGHRRSHKPKKDEE